MTKPVNLKDTTQDFARASVKPPGDLTGIVRFLARRAAERTWKAIKSKTTAPPKTEGDSP